MLQGACFDADRILGESHLRRKLITREDLLRWMAARDALEAQGRKFPSLAEWVVSEGILTPQAKAEIESRQIYAWLRRVRDGMTPIGRAGDSILIYRMP